MRERERVNFEYVESSVVVWWNEILQKILGTAKMI